MDNTSNRRWNDGYDDPPTTRNVSAPHPHAGVGQALRAAFDTPPRLPDDWNWLLGRLR